MPADIERCMQRVQMQVRRIVRLSPLSSGCVLLPALSIPPLHSSRPGILVLINDTDWELEDGLEYELKERDVLVFISTLHGG
jgi:hypothetical protein